MQVFVAFAAAVQRLTKRSGGWRTGVGDDSRHGGPARGEHREKNIGVVRGGCQQVRIAFRAAG